MLQRALDDWEKGVKAKLIQLVKVLMNNTVYKKLLYTLWVQTLDELLRSHSFIGKLAQQIASHTFMTSPILDTQHMSHGGYCREDEFSNLLDMFHCSTACTNHSQHTLRLYPTRFNCVRKHQQTSNCPENRFVREGQKKLDQKGNIL